MLFYFLLFKIKDLVYLYGIGRLFWLGLIYGLYIFVLILFISFVYCLYDFVVGVVFLLEMDFMIHIMFLEI